MSATQQRFIVTAVGKRNEQYDRVPVKAEDEEAAREKFSDYEGYEVHLRHENGGREWQTVFAKSEEKAREVAFERKIEYIEVLGVEPFSLDYTAEVTTEEEYYGR